MTVPERLARSLDRVGMSTSSLRVAGGTIGLSVAPFAFNLVITVVLTRLLGGTDFGAYVFAVAAANLIAIFALLGLSPLVLRNVAGYRVRRSWGHLRGILIRAHEVVLVNSMVLVVGAAAFGLVLRSTRPSVVGAYWIGLALVPLTALATVRQSAMLGLDRVLLARVPEALLQPATFLTLIVVGGAAGVLTGSTAVALLVTATAVAFVVGLVLLVRALPPPVRQARPVYETSIWMRSALPLFLLSGISTFNDQIDVIMLGMLKGPDAAGVFSVADRAAMFVSFFLVASQYPMAPRVARLWEQREVAELQRLVAHATRLVFVASVAVAAVLIVFGRQVLAVFGAEFTEGWSALVILSLGQLVNTGTGLVGMILMMIGREKDVVGPVALGSAAGIVLNLALVPPFGIVGAAVASAAGLAISNLLLLPRLWSRGRIWAAVVGRPRGPAVVA